MVNEQQALKLTFLADSEIPEFLQGQLTATLRAVATGGDILTSLEMVHACLLVCRCYLNEVVLLNDTTWLPLGMTLKTIGQMVAAGRASDLSPTPLEFSGMDQLIQQQRRFDKWHLRHRGPDLYTDLIEPLAGAIGFDMVETMLKRLEQKIDAARQLDDDGAAFKDITEKADDILAQLNELAKKE